MKTRMATPLVLVVLLVCFRALAQAWTMTSAPITNWTSVACSADGSKIVAAAGGANGAGLIYTSTNSGTTWAAADAPTKNWTAVASSADGTKLLAASTSYDLGFEGVVYASTNAGETWTAVTPLGASWSLYFTSAGSSADGSKLVVASSDPNTAPASGLIYLSSNSGTTWTNVNAANPWLSVAISANGNTFIAVGWLPRPGGFIPFSCLSTNFGVDWTTIPFQSLGSWTCAASSADGTKFVLGAGGAIYGSPIFVSPDCGGTWLQTSAPAKYWVSLASSADGTRLLAAARPDAYSGLTGAIYSSIDSGETWVSNSLPSTNWSGVASSADGNKLVAAVNGGGIYVSQTPPTPVIDVSATGTDLLLSWIIPSQPFVLQENADLTPTGWTDVVTTPVLNLTNLRNQVTLPMPASNRFYRLKHS